MTIAVELLFMFVFSHLLTAFFDDASHDLPSFLYSTNPQSHWSGFSVLLKVPEFW
jgi:hypothetical protein